MVFNTRRVKDNNDIYVLIFYLNPYCYINNQKPQRSAWEEMRSFLYVTCNLFYLYGNLRKGKPMIKTKHLISILLTFFSVLALLTPVTVNAAEITQLADINCPKDSILSPQGDILYVGSYCDGMMYAIHAAESMVTVKNTLFIGFEPTALAVSSDGKRLYVSGIASGSIIVIDTELMEIIKTFDIISPLRIAVDPTGKRIFFLSNDTGNVIAVDAETLEITGAVNIGAAPADIVVSNDGRLVYAAEKSEPRLFVIDAETLEIKRKASLETPPIRLRLSPDGSRLAVSFDIPSTTMSVPSDYGRLFDTSTLNIVGDKFGAKDIYFTKDGRAMYCIGSSSYMYTGTNVSVKKIILADGTVEQMVNTQNIPGGNLKTDMNEKIIYLSGYTYIDVRDAASFNRVDSIEVSSKYLEVSPVVPGRIFAYDTKGFYVVDAQSAYYLLNGPKEVASGEKWLYTATPVISSVESKRFLSGAPGVLSVDASSGFASGLNTGVSVLAVTDNMSGNILTEADVQVFDKSFLSMAYLSDPTRAVTYNVVSNTVYALASRSITFIDAESLQQNNINEKTLSSLFIEKILYEDSLNRIYAICTGTLDKTGVTMLIVIDGRTGHVIREIPFEEHALYEMILSPDKSRLILLGGFDGLAKTVDTETFAVTDIPGLPESFLTASQGYSGGMFYILSMKKLYKINAETSTVVSETSIDLSRVQYPDNMRAMAIASENKMLISISENRVLLPVENYVLDIDVDKGAVTAEIDIPNADNEFSSMDISTDKTYVCIGYRNWSTEALVACINTKTRSVATSVLFEYVKIRHMLIDNKRNVVYAILMSNNRKNFELVVFDMKTLTIIRREKIYHDPGYLALDAEGKRLFIACGYGVMIFSTEDGILPPQTPEYNVNGLNGHLTQWKRSRLNGWTGIDLTEAAGSGMTISGEPFPLKTKTAEYVFARSSSNRLFIWKQSYNGGWSARDLSEETGGILISGDPFAAVNEDDAGVKVLHVFAVDDGKHVREWWAVRDDEFHAEDLTVTDGGRQADGRPAYIYEHGVQHVMARDLNGRLVEWWWTADSGWHLEDISAATGFGGKIAGDPVYVYEDGVQNVYVRSDDNRLLEFQWTMDSGWRMEDLTASVGGAEITGNVAYTRIGSDRHIFARSKESALLEWWGTSSTQWHLENISAVLNGAHTLSADPIYSRINGAQYIYADGGADNPMLISWTAESGWGAMPMEPFYLRPTSAENAGWSFP